MNIAIIGAGNIGGTLGRKWALAGNQVVFGVRNPQASKVRKLLAAAGPRAAAAQIEEAVSAAELVLLAVPGGAVDGLVVAHAAALDGKIVIDATNKIGRPVMNALGTLRAAAPGAALFRAFNNLGWENFAEPAIGAEQVDLFYCGDEGAAQGTVDGLIAALGLRPVYLGGVEHAATVDALTGLYFVLAQQRGLGTAVDQSGHEYQGRQGQAEGDREHDAALEGQVVQTEQPEDQDAGVRDNGKGQQTAHILLQHGHERSVKDAHHGEGDYEEMPLHHRLGQQGKHEA